MRTLRRCAASCTPYPIGALLPTDLICRDWQWVYSTGSGHGRNPEVKANSGGNLTHITHPVIKWRIETEFETERSGLGLDENETRIWAGSHHHIAMYLLPRAFLLILPQD